MGYLDSVRKFAPLLDAENLDGKPGLSAAEVLAVGQLMEAWEPISVKSYQSQPQVQADMKAELQELYQNLVEGQRGPQLVYIDLTEVEQSYDESFQPYTKLPFAEWREDLLSNLEEKYTLPDGTRLNITFTFEKPKGEEYITALFPLSSFSESVSADEQLQVKFVRFLLKKVETGQADHFQPVKDLYDTTRSKRPDVPESEILIEVASHPEFQTYLAEKDRHLATTIRAEDISFGNKHKNEVIWLDARKFAAAFNPESQGKFPLWIQESPDRLATAVSEVMAHEIGHALGLIHPRLAISRRDVSAPPTVRPLHLMDVMLKHKNFPLGAVYFNDFAFVYLRFILGVDGWIDDGEQCVPTD